MKEIEDKVLDEISKETKEGCYDLSIIAEQTVHNIVKKAVEIKDKEYKDIKERLDHVLKVNVDLVNESVALSIENKNLKKELNDKRNTTSFSYVGTGKEHQVFVPEEVVKEKDKEISSLKKEFVEDLRLMTPILSTPTHRTIIELINKYKK